MIKVLEVRSDGTAVVSTAGLRRVIAQPGGDIFGELVTPEEASDLVWGYFDAKQHHTAEVIDYAEVYRRGAASATAARKANDKKARAEAAK